MAAPTANEGTTPGGVRASRRVPLPYLVVALVILVVFLIVFGIAALT
jgi:hypothetical protein